MKKTIFALLGTALLAGIYSFIPHTAKKEVATYSVSAEKAVSTGWRLKKPLIILVFSL